VKLAFGSDPIVAFFMLDSRLPPTKLYLKSEKVFGFIGNQRLMGVLSWNSNRENRKNSLHSFRIPSKNENAGSRAGVSGLK
tara:strand:+ start:425 stop:667 length:243 start_codon:yes stop_codon:yes gene_type:complete